MSITTSCYAQSLQPIVHMLLFDNCLVCSCCIPPPLLPSSLLLLLLQFLLFSWLLFYCHCHCHHCLRCCCRCCCRCLPLSPLPRQTFSHCCYLPLPLLPPSVPLLFFCCSFYFLVDFFVVAIAVTTAAIVIIPSAAAVVGADVIGRCHHYHIGLYLVVVVFCRLCYHRCCHLVWCTPTWIKNS